MSLSGEAPLNVGDESRMQYEYSSLPADARRQLYEYAVPKRDIWHEILDSVELNGAEQWLDIGTGRGHFPDMFRQRTADPQFFSEGFKGSMLGVDKYIEDFFPLWQVTNKTDPNSRVSYAYGDAEKLHWPDNSVDVVSALFLMYHLQNPELALEEFKRVLKPGGALVIATRGIDNQERLWRLGGHIADRVKAQRPRSFYERFPPEAAEHILSWMFDVEKVEVQHSPLEIPLDINPGDGEGWRDYRQALLSLYGLLRRKSDDMPVRAGKMLRVVDGEIATLFKEEAKRKGHFTDTVNQAYFICRNTKK